MGAASRNMPPAGADPSEQWDKLTELPRPLSSAHKVRFRGKDAEGLVFRVLTAQELSFARVAANREVREKLGDDAKAGNVTYEEELVQETSYQILALAARQADDPQFQFFPSFKAVREHLTDDEISVLMVAYGNFRRESGPVLYELTEAELEAWVELLMKGAKRDPLARCSGEVLTDLIMCLVSKLQAASSTGTSSAGLPREGSSVPSDAPPA